MKCFRSLFVGCLLLFVGFLQTKAFGQDSLSNLSVGSSVVMGEPTVQSLSAFRKVVLEQAKEIASDKSLSFKETIQARANVRRLTVLTLHRPTLEKMHQACAENVLSEGFSTSYGAIDWSKLAAFIKEMIPIILELIKFFM